MSIIKSAKNGFEGLFNFFECLTQDFQSFFWRWKLPAFLVLGLLSNIALGQTYQFPNNLQVGGGFMMGTNEVSTVYTEGTKDPLLLTMKEVGDLSCESPTIYMTGGRLLILGCGVSNSQNYDKVFEIRKNNGDSFNAESVLLTPSTYRAFPTSPYELLFNVYLRGFKNNVQKGEIHLTNLVHAQNYPINFSNYAGFNDIDMLYIFVDNQDLFVDDLTLSPLAAVPVLPTLTTNSATGILSDRAVLGGNVTNDGGATISARGIVWSTSPNPTVTSNRVNMGTGSGSFSATVTGLPASSTVYVRSFAVNSAGTAYGNQISFTTPAKLVAQILSITGESCNGNDGSASIGAIGGTPPYSFLWEFDNSTLSSRNDLTAGTYTIRVSDSAGDRSTAIVNLGAQAPLNISLNLSQVSCFGGSNGAASVTVTGGTGVYTYTWSVAGQSGSRIENLTAGSYSITVRDQSGCQSVQNFTITEPSMLSASVTSVTDATCIGGNNGAAQISVSGGTPPYTYSWSPSGGSSPAIFNVSAGTYQVLIRDANFCEVTQTVTIREPNLPLLVSTNSATEVLSTSARISGSATQDLSGFGESESCVSKVGFVYSTTSNPEIGNGTVAYVNPFTLSGFSGLLLNLRPNSVYYARAFVENSTGSVTYGNEQSFTTAPLNLSIGGSFSVSPKTYDGNSTATISFYSLVLSGLNPSFNRVGLEDVVVEFETAEAGINKPVRIVSANITGPDASSYNFSLLNSPTSTGTILKRNLSITGLTASSKTYDGTTNAVVTGTPVLSGVLDGDDVTLSGTPEYDFVTSNAGQAIEIGVTGISLSGSEASNYELFPPVWFGDILRRQLLMGDPSITVQKVFDGTRQASFVLGAPLNLVTGDEVVVTGSAQYEDANVGVGKQIVLTYGVSGNAASNYLAPVPFTRTDGEITPADLRITVSSETKVFGELDPVFTLQYSGFVFGDDVSVVVGTPVFSRDPEENVGNYPVVVSGLSSANYAVQLVPGNLEITQRRIQVTMPFLSKSYGDVDPALTYTTAPALGTVLPNGIRVELNGSLQREPGEDVGDYRIDIGTIKDLNPNYLIGYVGGLLSIVPKEVRVSADSKSKTYGDLDPAFTYTSIPGEGEELANGLRVSFTGELERQPGEAVGTYVISRGTLSNPNFNIVFQNGQLEITPLSVEVRADAKTKVYGELDPTLTYSTLPALGTVLSNGEILSLSGVLNRMEGEDVGRYAIGVGTLNHPNLSLRYVGSELEITRRQVVVTAEGKTKVFGEIDPALTYGSVPAIASVLPNGEVVSFAGSLTREPGEEVGTYPIRLGSLTNPNYSVVFNGADLEITPLSVTVNADSQQKIYGDLDPEFKFLSIPSLGTILPNGSILSFSGKLSREAGENVGSYAIELGNLTNPNYVISYIGGELEIKPLPIKVTANNQSKAFGELDPQLTYASVPAAGSILENGQVVSFLGTLDREPGENVGNYPIKQGSLTNPNYQIDFISGILTINPFKVRIVANAGSKVYGENDPSLTFTSSIQPESTLPNGQVFTLTGSLSRNPGENVGTYSINQGNLNSPNIQFEFVGADFTIQPKSLEIVPLGNQRKVYGEPDPDFQFRVNGLLPRDPSSIISGDISRVQGEDVNAYKFTLGNLSAGPNYSLILKEEVFKIEPKALILRAGNKEKRYGDPNPELTYTFEGLANGDTGIDQLPTISTSANQSSSVGIYPIRLTGGLDRNYSLTLINGELRVLKRSILVKANDQEMIYGDQVPSLTYQYVGLVNGDRDLETNPSVETIASSNSNVGTYPIRVSGGADRNYELAYQNGLLTIRPRELQVVADSKMREFGDLNPVLTYTLSGLVNKDNDLTVRPVLSLSANQSSVVGTYPIGISGGSHPNYSLVYKEGVLEILPAKLTVTAQPASKVFGANDPDLSFSATGFKLSDGIGLGIGKLNRPAGEAVGTYPIGIGSLSFGVNYMVRFEGADFKIVPVEILAYNELAEIQTPWGIVPELPDEVQIVTQDARIISVQVNWASNELNVFAKGVYFIKGEILETGDIKNPEGISPTLKVTVLPKPSSEDLILSNNRFIPDPDNFFQAIGNFRVIDPVDNVHSISLVQQELDNGFFEIKENILFWSSADQASGKSQFTIRVQVKDRDGNTLIKDFTILRERVVLESLEVYNSFSPNGDGFNDTWGVPDLRYYKNVRVHIFNKEGRRVFYTENPDFRWDGSFEDVELATDTFQWVIEIKETGEKRNGTLHLIR
ncbi:MAG: gliding motility-associated C-terminal domain-containing protein [Flavobacteriales bacterium]|nr:gliding motility-associated C-terminal domain-containing protein [Flavobacteriales bacterium]